MEMTLYQTLDEKKQDFACVTIDSIEELRAFIREQQDYKPAITTLRFGNDIISSDDLFPRRSHYIIYRGIKESKFHLNTSLQLHWSEIQKRKKKLSQLDYLSELVGLLKKNEAIIQFEKNKGKQFTDIGLLALMQHYRLPTPLMDWTPDIVTGLNFAGDGMSDGTADDEISNYVSLYYINLQKNFELEKSSYQNLLEISTSQIKEIADTEEAKGADFSIGSLNKLFTLKDIGIDQIFIDYADDAPKVVDIFGATLDLTNPNINKQSGAFIINFSEECFLDQLWNRKTDSSNDVILESKIVTDSKTGLRIQVESSENPYAKGYLPNTKISCANIKKSVLKDWLSNGGEKCHYDESEDSLKLKDAIQHEYEDWLRLQ